MKAARSSPFRDSVVTSTPMLGRLWFSAAWFFGVGGVAWIVGLSWHDYAANKAGLVGDLQLLMIEVVRDGGPPIDVCWLSEYGHITIHPAAERLDPRQSLLDSAPCIQRLKANNEDLAAANRRCLFMGFAGLFVWPALVFGVYRWGLWLVGVQREPLALKMKESADPSSPS